MHSVETYLKALSDIHRTGGATAESSYYSALETLLNEVGVKLKPKVRAVAQLVNTGAGQPDFGLYTANQFQRAKDENGTLEMRMDWLSRGVESGRVLLDSARPRDRNET